MHSPNREKLSPNASEASGSKAGVGDLPYPSHTGACWSWRRRICCSSNPENTSSGVTAAASIEGNVARASIAKRSRSEGVSGAQ